MLLINPTVGLAYRFPIPSANTLPTKANTSGFSSPVIKLPKFVLLPTRRVVVPVEPEVPGGAAGTGIINPPPFGTLVPAAVAPSKKNPDLVAVNLYEPTTSPFPEHVRACSAGLKLTAAIMTVAA